MAVYGWRSQHLIGIRGILMSEITSIITFFTVQLAFRDAEVEYQ